MCGTSLPLRQDRRVANISSWCETSSILAGLYFSTWKNHNYYGRPIHNWWPIWLCESICIEKWDSSCSSITGNTSTKQLGLGNWVFYSNLFDWEKRFTLKPQNFTHTQLTLLGACSGYPGGLVQSSSLSQAIWLVDPPVELAWDRPGFLINWKVKSSTCQNPLWLWMHTLHWLS